jgi:hypothetical protein
MTSQPSASRVATDVVPIVRRPAVAVAETPVKPIVTSPDPRRRARFCCTFSASDSIPVAQQMDYLLNGRTMTQILMRRREAAAALAVSQAQILKWETAGLLRRIDLKDGLTDGGGIRAVRYAASDVEALGKRFIANATELTSR